MKCSTKIAIFIILIIILGCSFVDVRKLVSIKKVALVSIYIPEPYVREWTVKKPIFRIKGLPSEDKKYLLDFQKILKTSSQAIENKISSKYEIIPMEQLLTNKNYILMNTMLSDLYANLSGPVNLSVPYAGMPAIIDPDKLFCRSTCIFYQDDFKSIVQQTIAKEDIDAFIIATIAPTYQRSNYSEFFVLGYREPWFEVYGTLQKLIIFDKKGELIAYVDGEGVKSKPKTWDMILQQEQIEAEFISLINESINKTIGTLLDKI